MACPFRSTPKYKTSPPSSRLPGQALAGTSPHSRVAILQSYDSHWAIDFQRHTRLFDYDDAVMDVYRAVSPLAQGVDIVSPDADLSGYAVVFAPALNVLSAAARAASARLRAGRRPSRARPSLRHEGSIRCAEPERQPGPLAGALGAHVEQFYALDPKDPAPALSGQLGLRHGIHLGRSADARQPRNSCSADLWAGATGSNGWLAGHPAAVEHAVGKGTLTYIGAMLDPKLMQASVAQMLSTVGVAPILPDLPTGVELMQRSAPGHRPVWILINHTSTPQHIALPHGMNNLLQEQGAATAAAIDLNAHGVAVLDGEQAQ